MPTPEEIKKIAREYETQLSSFFVTAEEVAADFIEWLSKDYCIVPKKEIKADYDFNALSAGLFAKGASARCAQMREWHQGKCDELISLFGKELFEEEKE